MHKKWCKRVDTERWCHCKRHAPIDDKTPWGWTPASRPLAFHILLLIEIMNKMETHKSAQRQSFTPLFQPLLAFHWASEILTSLHLHLPMTDPLLWDNDHVRMWLEWTIREYGLHDTNTTQFNRFYGKDLCRLSKDDFGRLTNPCNGEILFAHLQFFRQCKHYSKQHTSSSIVSMLNIFQCNLAAAATAGVGATYNLIREKSAQALTNEGNICILFLLSFTRKS